MLRSNVAVHVTIPALIYVKSGARITSKKGLKYNPHLGVAAITLLCFCDPKPIPRMLAHLLSDR